MAEIDIIRGRLEIGRKLTDLLLWNQVSMNVIPEVPGVYVLRNFPSPSGIIYIGSSKNLRDRLQKHLTSGDIPEVTFFDWYPTETVDQAREQERNWILQYSPKYNVRLD